MKLSEIDDQESYVYIRAVMALSNKFKVGDYIKTFSFSEYDEAGDELSPPRWQADVRNIASFRSRLMNNNNVHVTASVIHQITMISDGYIEAREVKLSTDENNSIYQSLDPSNLTGYSLREEVENYVCNLDYDEVDADTAVSFFADNYLQLDEDYADSIIMESEYVPYSNSIDIKSQLLKIEALRLAEEKELLRRARVRGWDTRRRNIEHAAKIATTLAIKKPAKKVIKKKVIKRKK